MEAFTNKLIWRGVIIIFIFGGLGIWKEIAFVLYKSESIGWIEVTSAFIVFYPVLIILSSMELIVLQTSGKTTNASKAMNATMFIIGPVVLIITMVLMFLEYLGVFHEISLILSTVFSLVGLWMWGFANVGNPSYSKKSEFDDSVGGKLDKRLNGEIKEGFKT